MIWMFPSRYLNNALNSIHQRALRLIYNDNEQPFDRILEDNNLKIPSRFNTTDHECPICDQGG